MTDQIGAQAGGQDSQCAPLSHDIDDQDSDSLNGESHNQPTSSRSLDVSYKTFLCYYIHQYLLLTRLFTCAFKKNLSDSI